MHVEVDQSGRIDQTNKPTVLAMANGDHYSVRVSAVEKRKILQALRRQKPRWSTALINVFVFSTLLFFLLKERIKKITLAVIDEEFTGHEPLIKDRIMTLCRSQGIVVYKDQIAFKQVTKKSPSHKLAWRVYNSLIKPDLTLTAEDVLREFGEQKK